MLPPEYESPVHCETFLACLPGGWKQELEKSF